MKKISVIIPLSKDEVEHKDLISSIHDDIEIILSSEETRAISLNKGAEKSTGEYLWFLHADSEIDSHAISALQKAIQKNPASLLYFDLTFAKNSSPIMILNAWGAWLRSHILKVPFGDQGFCISRKLFENIGGFPEGIEYGEDHLFVWRARQKNISIKSVGAKIYTSARKYKKYGWLKTTLMHQYLWIKQAWPEWRKLHRQK